MVGIVTGSGLGLLGGSKDVLGGAGELGGAGLGQAGGQINVNAKTGNLIVTQADELLAGLGPDIGLVRTYNSGATFDFDNGDGWQVSLYRKIYGLTGGSGVNTTGSSVQRHGADGSILTYTYDSSAGKYINKNGAGSYDTLSYDSGTQKWTWTDGDSRASESYEANPLVAGEWRIKTVADLSGNTLTYSYDATLGVITQVQDANGETTQLTYDGNKRLQSVQTIVGGVTSSRVSYSYDGNGRLSVVTTDLDGAAGSQTYTTTYTYAGTTTRIIGIANSDGTSLTIGYDGSNRVSTLTDGAGKITTLTYTNSTTTTVTDPLSLNTVLTFDTAGNLTRMQGPSGSGVDLSYSYNASGDLTSTTDSRGNATTFGYDGQGNLLRSQDAAGNVVERTYNSANQLIRQTRYAQADTDGTAGIERAHAPETTNYYYDASQRLRFIVSPEGRVTEYQYDAYGQVTETRVYTDFYNPAAAANWTTNFNANFAYVASQIASDSVNGTLTFTSVNQSTVQSTGARLVSRPLGTRWRFEFTTPASYASNVFCAQTLGGELYFWMGSNGDLSLGAKVNGAMVYSSAKYKSGTAYVVEITFDADGLGTLSLVEKGAPVSSATVIQSRLSVSATPELLLQTQSGPGAAAGTSGSTTTVVVSNLTNTPVTATADLVTWAAGQTWMERTATDYDARGLVKTVTRYAGNDGNGVASRTDYTYDAHGQLLQKIDPRGTATTGVANDYLTAYAYDGLGRVISVTAYDAAGSAVGAGSTAQTLTTYTDTAKQISVRLANDLVRVSTYDTRGLLVSQAEQTLGGSVLSSTSYAYDADGRLRVSTDPTGQKSYLLYDSLGQAIGAIDATGALAETVYNKNGQAIKTIRYANKVTANLTTLFAPSGGTIPDVAIGSVRPATDAQDRISFNLYDSAGRVAKTINALGAVTEFKYDGTGRLTDTIAYANPLTGAQFTALKNASVEVLPGDANATPVADSTKDRRTRSFYSADGLLMGVLDGEGYLIENTYNAAGERTQTVRYATQTNSANWATGTLASLRPTTAASDQKSVYFYDGQGRLAGNVDAEGYLTETQYDTAGNATLTKRYANKALAGTTLAAVRPANHTEDQLAYSQYDAQNRLTSSQQLPDGTTTLYGYDKVGNLTLTTTASGSAEQRLGLREYDLQGRVTRELAGEGVAALNALVAPTQAQIDDVWNRYGTRYTYDAAGRRIATIAPDGTSAAGRKTVFYYDGAGRLTHSINALGEATEYRYDSFGELTRTIQYATRIAAATVATLTGGQASSLGSTVSNLAGAADRITQTGYDAAGHATSVTDALTNVNTVAYNAFGEAISQVQKIDAGTNVTTGTSYDRRGFGTQTVEDVGGGLTRTVSVVRDAFGRVTQSTDARNNLTTTSYDRLGRQLSITDPGGSRSSVYDAFGRVLTQTDGMSNTVTYTYDSTNRSVTVSTAEGVATTTVKNRHGQTVSVTDGRGNVSTYTYDRDGQLTGTVQDSGVGHLNLTGGTTYDAAGQVFESTDARGTQTRYTYDAAGRVLTRAVDPSGLNLVTTYRYDALGQAVWAKDSLGVWTRTDYDAQGQVTAVVRDPANVPDASGTLVANPTGLNLTTTYTFDARGKTLTVTTAAGTAQARTTQYVYDKLGRRIQEIVDPGAGKLNLTTGYAYDAADNLVTRTDAAGNLTRYTYDAANRLAYTVDATGAVTLNAYDAEDRVVQVTAYATRINLSGLALAPTSAQITALLAPNAADQVVRSVYDKDGRLAVTLDALNYATRREYDSNGNVVKATRYAAAYTGSLIPNILPTLTPGAGDEIVQTVYDAANRAIVSVDALGYVTAVAYDAAGNAMRTTRYANALVGALTTNVAPAFVSGAGTGTYVQTSGADQVSRAAYDAAGRLRYAVDAGGYAKETRYDALGQITQTIQYATTVTVGAAPSVTDMQTALAAVANAAKDQSNTFAYDNAGRLTGSTDAEGYGESYQYDAAGNKTSFTNKKGSVWSYQYDATGRLTRETTPQVEVTRLTQNADGSVTPATTTEAVVTVIVYDALDNVQSRTEAWGTVDARTTSYVYDAAGNQIQTTFPAVGVYNAAADNLSANGAGGQVARTEQTVLPANHVSFDAFGRAVVNQDVAGVYSYKVYDTLGRVRFEIDGEHYLTAYSYDGFGNVLQTTRYATRLTFADTRSTAFTATEVQTLIVGGADDRVLSNSYDKSNQLIQVVEPATYTYDADAPVGSQYFTAGKTTQKTYDGFGRLVAQSVLKNPLTNAWVDTYFYYDVRGNKAAQVDALGYLSTWQYDETGDMVGQTEYAKALAAGSWGVASYGAPTSTNRITSPNDPLGYDRITTWQYDRKNQKVGETRVDIEYGQTSGTLGLNTVFGDQTSSFGYDGVGNLIRTTDALGGTSYVYYDALGRTSASAAPSRTQDGIAATVTMPPLTMGAAGTADQYKLSFAKAEPAGVTVGFRFRQKGTTTWTTAVLSSDATSYWLDTSNLFCDQYEYELTYTRTGSPSPYATGSGNFLTLPNGNHFTANNINAAALSNDTPTSNYPTFKASTSPMTVSNGGLRFASSGLNPRATLGTQAIPATGKYYFEYTPDIESNSNNGLMYGLASANRSVTGNMSTAGDYGFYSSNLGTLVTNGVSGSWTLPRPTAGSTVRIAVDVDAGKMWIGINGIWLDSAGGSTGNPATGANATFTGSFAGKVPLGYLDVQSSVGANANFGQKTFAVTPPSGFNSLSQNMSETTGSSHSLLFNAANSQYLSKTPTVDGNRKTWTYGASFKISDLVNGMDLLSVGVDGYNYDRISINSSGQFIATSWNGTSPGVNQWNLTSTALFTDPSAWYQVVFSYDSTQATPADRLKLFVNGVQITSFANRVNPSQNFEGYVNSANQHRVMSFYANVSSAVYSNGYLSNVDFVDGQALDASALGFTAGNGKWIPKDYVGGYGSNGFEFNFDDAANLGRDTSRSGVSAVAQVEGTQLKLYGNTTGITAINIAGVGTRTPVLAGAAVLAFDISTLPRGSYTYTVVGNGSFSGSFDITSGSVAGAPVVQEATYASRKVLNVANVPTNATAVTLQYRPAGSTNAFINRNIGKNVDGGWTENYDDIANGRYDTVVVVTTPSGTTSTSGQIEIKRGGTFLPTVTQNGLATITLTPVTSFKRDIFGNAVQQIDYSKGAASVNSQTWQLAGTDAVNDRVTSNVFDAHGHIIRSVNAEGASKYTSYNISGSAVKDWQPVTDIDGKIRNNINTYEYDKVGRQITTTDASFATPADRAPLTHSLAVTASSNQYLSRVQTVGGDTKKWTLSMSVKRGELGATAAYENLFQAYSGSANNFAYVYFDTNDQLCWSYSNLYYAVVTTRTFKSTSDWYNLTFVMDTDNADPTKRYRIFVNGAEETSYATDNRAGLSGFSGSINAASSTMTFGANYNGTDPANMSFAGINFIDGLALDANSFGVNIGGKWIPKDYTGSYGNTGFELNFDDATNLGQDTSGRSNTWTANNLTSAAQLNDAPTNNYATLNLGNTFVAGNSFTLSNNNLTFKQSTATQATAVGTGFKVSSGKWYFETTQVSKSSSGDSTIPIGITGDTLPGSGFPNNSYYYLGYGAVYNRRTATTLTTSSVLNGDTVMCAIDMDSGKVWFGKNGVWYNNGNPLTGANPTFSDLKSYASAYEIFVGNAGGNSSNIQYNLNPGQRGFLYAPPTGFSAFNQKTPEPVAGAAHSVQLNSNNNQSLTGTNATSVSDGTKATFSTWFKKTAITTSGSDAYSGLFYAGTNNVDRTYVGFARVTGTDHYELVVGQDNGSGASSFLLKTSVGFTDPTLWQNVSVVYDSTQAVASERIRIYVDGVRITSFAVANYPPQNWVASWQLANKGRGLGKSDDRAISFFDGFIGSTNFIDGQAVDPSAFGVTVNGKWVPRDYTGSYGSNGFELNFDDATNLGKDTSGAFNNLTANNLTGAAQVADNAANNFAILNPNDTGNANMSVSNADLTFIKSGANFSPLRATQAISGLKYFEARITSGALTQIGVANNYNITQNGGDNSVNASGGIGAAWDSRGYMYRTGGSDAAASFTAGDIIMVAVDSTTGKIWFGKNGVWNTGNPVLGTSPSYTATGYSVLYPFFNGENGGGATVNFGQKPFAYAPPAGFSTISAVTPVTATAAPPVMIKEQVRYNAFGEISGKGTNDGWQEFYNYDNAGHGWRTNEKDGVAKVRLFDLLGNVTSELKSQTEDLASGAYTKVENVLAAVNRPLGNSSTSSLTHSLGVTSGSNQYLSRTLANSGNTKKWTMSMWVKRGELAATGAYETLFCGPGSNYSTYTYAYFDLNNKLCWSYSGANYALVTNRSFTNTSDWYNLTFVMDTDNTDPTKRYRIFVNGTEETSYAVDNRAGLAGQPSSFNAAGAQAFGANYNGTDPANMAFAGINFVDGLALDASAFGMNASGGKWIPKDYTGSYGNTGFELNFDDPVNLGKDTSGRSNNWTTNNLTGNSQLADAPSNNFATLSPASVFVAGNPYTLTNNNLTFTQATATQATAIGTGFKVSSGKWYFETTQTNKSGNVPAGDSSIPIGIAGDAAPGGGFPPNSYYYMGYGGIYNRRTTTTLTGSQINNGDTVMCAIDMDTGKVWFGKNGVWYNNGNPLTGANATFSDLKSYAAAYEIFVGNAGGGIVGLSYTLNAGQRSFLYTPPAGFTGFSQKTPEPVSGSHAVQLNSASNQSLTGTNATSVSDGTKATFSTWFKKTAITTSGSDAYSGLFYAGTNNVDRTYVGFARVTGTDHYELVVGQDNGSGASSFLLKTSVGFTDPTLWQNVSVVYDSTQAVASERIRIYVDGVRITSFAVANYPPQNWVASWQLANKGRGLGKSDDRAISFFDGFIGSTNFIDGQAVDPSAFGVTVNGKWVPRDYTGSYGSNGFELAFDDSSNLAKDTSGAASAWVLNNLTSAAQVSDSPFSNFAILNPNDTGNANMSVSNADLTFTKSGANFSPLRATQAISGLKYFEVKVNNGALTQVGVANNYNITQNGGDNSVNASGGIGAAWDSRGYLYRTGGSSSVTGFSSGDVIMVAVDSATGKIWFGKNGVWNSGNPALGTSPSYTVSGYSALYPFFNGENGGSGTVNFGQRQFAYAPPAGFSTIGTDTQVTVSSAAAPISVQRTQMVYDKAGRVIKQIAPSYSMDTTTYTPTMLQTLDRWGNVIAATDPRNAAWVTSARYDSNNQQLEQRLPQVDVTGENGVTTAQTPTLRSYYDLLGRKIGSTDANGNNNTVRYDGGGQVVSEYRADGGLAKTQYDIFGNKIRSVDPAGNGVDYVYDRNGNLLKQKHASGEENYVYDAAGNRIRETNALGISTDSWYDSHARLIRSRLPLGQTSSLAYDARGNKITESNANGEVQRWTYDYFGRQVNHVDLGGAVLSYTYNYAGSLKQQSSSRGQSLRYAYYENGLLKTITDLAVNAETLYEYDLAGNRTREKYSKTGATQQDARTVYDALGRIAQTQDSLYTIKYAYDAVGNRRRVLSSYTDENGLLRTVDNWYLYDKMNRITLSQGVLVDGQIVLVAAPAVTATTTLTDLIGINGNDVTYNGTEGWGNADLRSNIGYVGSAYVSARAGQTSMYSMIGLNSDPLSDKNYSSLDYAWYPALDGELYIYENGSNVGFLDSYTETDVLAIEYTGTTVRYLKNGTVLYTSTTTANRTFYLDSSFYSTGFQFKDVRFGGNAAQAAQTPVVFGKDIDVVGNNITYGGLGGNWANADAHSTQSYTGGAYLSVRPAQNNIEGMFGINSDPLTNTSYSSLDFAWYLRADGNLYIYEQATGFSSSVITTYQPNDLLSIEYSGTTVLFKKNGVTFRTTTTTAGRTFYFDTGFYGAGMKLNDVKFGADATQAATAPLTIGSDLLISGNDITYQGPGGSWGNVDAHSEKGYTGNALVSAKITQANTEAVFGLNDDPTASKHYSSIDFGWYIRPDMTLYYWESSGGSFVACGTYALGDVLSIEYDNTSVRYKVNGVVRRTTTTDANRTFYFDSDFWRTGSKLSDVRMGPYNANAVQIAYDAAGNRRLATKYEGGVLVNETYTYDADNRLIATIKGGNLNSARVYDAASRVTENLSYTTAGALNERRVSTYDANSRMLTQDIYNGSGTKTQSMVYTAYQGTGEVLSYRVSVLTGTNYTNYFNYTYAKFDGYKEKLVAGTSTYFQAGNTTTVYDANGNIVSVDDQFNTSKHRDFITDQAGNILKKTENGKTQNYFYANGKPLGSSGALSAADFDYNYTPVSDSYPGNIPGSYVVSTGDTLRSIALAMFGDAQLWYLIADANGLKTDSDLKVGRSLTVPNRITNLRNAADTFKPYAPGQIIGDTTPTLPDPPPPPQPSGGGKKGCGGLGTIIMVVVAVVATVLTAGALAPAVAGQSLFAAGTAALGAGTATIGFTGLAIAGAVGSIASQVVGMAIGAQEKFSWGQVAMGAISSMAGGAATSIVGTGSTLPNVLARAAVGNVITQGIAVATGLQDKFSWKSVAASAVGSAVSYGLAQTDLAKNLNDAFGSGIGSVVNKTLTGVASGIARELVSGGKVRFAQIAADSFGNALGDAIVAEARISASNQTLESMNETEQETFKAAVRSGANDNEAMQLVERYRLSQMISGINLSAGAAGADDVAQRKAEVEFLYSKIGLVEDGAAVMMGSRTIEPGQIVDKFNSRISTLLPDPSRIKAGLDNLIRDLADPRFLPTLEDSYILTKDQRDTYGGVVSKYNAIRWDDRHYRTDLAQFSKAYRGLDDDVLRLFALTDISRYQNPGYAIAGDVSVGEMPFIYSRTTELSVLGPISRTIGNLMAISNGPIGIHSGTGQAVYLNPRSYSYISDAAAAVDIGAWGVTRSVGSTGPFIPRIALTAEQRLATTLADVESTSVLMSTEVYTAISTRTGDIAAQEATNSKFGERVSDRMAEAMRDNIFTHNHTSGGPLGVSDIMTGLVKGAREIRAVGSDTTKIMNFAALTDQERGVLVVQAYELEIAEKAIVRADHPNIQNYSKARQFELASKVLENVAHRLVGLSEGKIIYTTVPTQKATQPRFVGGSPFGDSGIPPGSIFRFDGGGAI